MKNFLKQLVAVCLVLGISLTGVSTAFAADLTWTVDQTIDLSTPDINLTILTGSKATNLLVNAGNIQVVVASGDSFTVRSTDRELTFAGVTTSGVSNDCTNGVALLTINGGPSGETITVTPASNACAVTGGGGGSGGGGTTPTPTPTPLFPPSIPVPPIGQAHSVGSVVKTSDGTVWFITQEGTRRAFTSGGAFLSYGFLSFAIVEDANSGDIALPQGSFIPPQDGKIVCSDRTDSYAVKGTCYLITMGKRAAFTSSAVFTGQGFKFSRAMTGDVSFMVNDSNISSASMAHRPGVLVNNAGTVQLVGPSSLMGIPTENVFTSWGYSFADTVPANSADRAILQSGVMVSRVLGQLSPPF